MGDCFNQIRTVDGNMLLRGFNWRVRLQLRY